MTRINVVSPSELSDAWLLAEYRELPRVILQQVNTADAPKKYLLGAGHVKWAKKHSSFVVARYVELCREMKSRGFKVNFSCDNLTDYHLGHTYVKDCNFYEISAEDIALNRQRLIERYKSNPNAHRWTYRNKPSYLEV